METFEENQEAALLVAVETAEADDDLIDQPTPAVDELKEPAYIMLSLTESRNEEEEKVDTKNKTMVSYIKKKNRILKEF